MINEHARRGQWGVLISLLLIVSCAGHPYAADTLFVYSLESPEVDSAMVADLGRDLIGSGGVVTEGREKKRFFYRSGHYRLEVYKASGGIWLQDTTALWNPELNPELPDSATLEAARDSLLRVLRSNLLKDEDPALARLEFTSFGKSQEICVDVATGNRTQKQLDVHLNFAVRVAGSVSLNQEPGLPVTGGGGEFKVILGDKGDLIGLSGVWRPIKKDSLRRVRVKPPEQIRDEFLPARAGESLQSVTLAYNSRPVSEFQDTLEPVYLLGVVERVNGKVIVYCKEAYAVEGDGESEADSEAEGEPVQERTVNSHPPEGSTNPEGSEKSNSEPRREAGAVWLGPLGNLEHSAENARRFLDVLKADGWDENFNWGEKNAWLDDWMEHRGDWVDAADIVYYSGHADPTGWTVWNPKSDERIDVTCNGEDESSPTGLWGENDLEWVAISACGPLQDQQIDPQHGGDAVARWKKAFGGLHLLLGYATTQCNNYLEGERFATYAVDGNTLADSWFRATLETQGQWLLEGSHRQVVSAVMYPLREGKASPYDDHLWGHGDVAPDLKGKSAPDTFCIVFSQD